MAIISPSVTVNISNAEPTAYRPSSDGLNLTAAQARTLRQIADAYIANGASTTTPFGAIGNLLDDIKAAAGT